MLEHFAKRNCKKQTEKEFRVEKVIKRKGDKPYIKWKVYNNVLIVGLIKRYCYTK